MIAINFACAKNFPDEIRQKARIFVPQIGKVTTAMLQRNLLRLAKYSAMKLPAGTNGTSGAVTHDTTQYSNGNGNAIVTHGGSQYE